MPLPVGSHQIDAEDPAVATLRFQFGALGMTSTSTPPVTPSTVTLRFAAGGIDLGPGAPSVTLTTSDRFRVASVTLGA